MEDSGKNTYGRLAGIPLPSEAKPSTDLHFGLIVPPSPFVVPCGWEWVHTAPFEGPSILASLIKGLGYKFTLLDQRDNPDPGGLEGKLDQFDFIGVATYEDNFPYVKKACEIAKENNGGRPVILGGPLVTSVPELLMKNTRADYAVFGEGELTTIELMDYLTGNAHALPVGGIDGLAWKNAEGEVSLNKPREQMATLDAVPIQDLSVWERFKGRSIPEIYLSFSRGCPNNCSFCFRAMPRLRFKSVERVRREIDYLKQHNFRMVWWNDLTFLANKAHVRRLLDDAFTAHDFRWCCFTRVTGVDLETLKHMKARGCDLVMYGFESLSPKILDYYNKGISKNDMLNAISLTREAGLKVGGLFIVGAPGETKESLKWVVDFCREFREVTRVKYLSAIPGTGLYKQAVKDGIIKDELSHLYFLAREQSVEGDVDKEGFLVFAEGLTKDDLREAYRQVNGVIERRPYDYSGPENVYLEECRKFEMRPLTPS